MLNEHSKNGVRERITLETLRAWNAYGATHPVQPLQPGWTVLGMGAELGLPPPPDYQPYRIAIPDEVRSGHIGCFGTTRVGKAQPLDARVWTATGWRAIGEVQMGWELGTPAGGWATVIAVYPQGMQPIYRVRTEDGRTARATQDHLWLVRATKAEERLEGLLRTGQVRRLLEQGYWVELPLTRAVSWQRPRSLVESQNLDPIVFGYLVSGWLRSERGRIQFVPPRGLAREHIRRHQHAVRQAVQRWCERTGKREGILASHLREWRVQPARLAEWLQALPDPAGWPIAERQALIAVWKQLASPEAVTTWRSQWPNAAVGYWLAQVIWSLGGKATVQRTTETAVELQVTWPTDPVTTLPATESPLGWGIAITAVERDEDAEAQCILLDDPAGLYLTDGWLVTHNTRLMESIIRQDIQKGYSVIAIDPKGDHELVNMIVQTAVETGRLEEVMLLTPIFPDYSIRVGPLTSYYMQEELVNMLISGVKAREEFFVAIAQEIGTLVVAGELRRRELTGDTRPLTFQDIKDRIGFRDLQLFIQDLEPLPGLERVVHSLKQLVESPNLADYFSKVSSTFRTFLSAVTSGATGEIIGRATVNPVISRLERGERVILIVQMGSLLTQRTSGLVGKLLIAMIQALVGRLFASGQKLNPPLCLHIDEGHNVLYLGFQELINKGGGANCWVHFYTQSVAQIAAEVGADYAQSIIDNINTWIYMLVNHPDTAAHIEAASPRRTRYDTIVPAGEDPTIRVIEQPFIRADRVLQLPKRWCYMRSYGRVWKFQTLESPPSWLKITWPTVPVHGNAEEGNQDAALGKTTKNGSRNNGSSGTQNGL